jgi:hypothetical protein
MAHCYKCGTTLQVVMGMRGLCQTCRQIEVTEELNKTQEKNLRLQEDALRRQREYQNDLAKASEKAEADRRFREELLSDSKPTYRPKPRPKVETDPPTLQSRILECGGPDYTVNHVNPYVAPSSAEVDTKKYPRDYTELRDGLLGLLFYLVILPLIVYVGICLAFWLLKVFVWWVGFFFVDTPPWIWLGF